MTYKTLEYDMNSPCLKQVVEPLDSAYGLAIRVVKDGQVVPLHSQGDIVVDGQDSVRLKGTWQLFELSSGSEPQTKTLSVEVHAVFDTDVDNGTEDAGFELRVQEQDLGYIEPAVFTGYGQA